MDENERVEMSCRVQAEPAAAVTWYRDGIQITSGQNGYHTSYVNGSLKTKNLFTQQIVLGVATLLIDRAQESHDGVYSARAVNEVGVADTRARLTVRCRTIFSNMTWYFTIFSARTWCTASYLPATHRWHSRHWTTTRIRD